jgi:hypothetical protein
LGDGGEILSDYLDSSTIKFVKGKEFKEIPIISLYAIIKGFLYLDRPSSASLVRLLNNDNLYTIISDGSFYSTGLSNTLILFRKNIKPFIKTINIFTSLASSVIIRLGNSDMNIINSLMAKKIGFTIKDYNYYLRDYYYDYNKNKLNQYALKLIKISAIIVFIWHLIYKKATELNINIDYPFYITFYLSIFDNLNGTNPILSEQINPYFINYDPSGILSPIDDICITKWSNIISKLVDTPEILIYKMSSRILNQNELINYEITNNYDKLKLSYNLVSQRLNECFIYKDEILSTYGLLDNQRKNRVL